jgi:hypothetical protein
VKRLIGVSVAAMSLLLALLACNLAPSSPEQPGDSIPTLGTLYNTRVPTLIPATPTPTDTPTHTPVPPTNTPVPTDTPEPTQVPPTAVPPTQGPPPPPPPPTSPPVHESAGQPFATWWHIEGVPTIDEANNQASHVVYLDARGGSGIYRYFHGGQELDGPTFVVTWTLCAGFITDGARIEDTAGNAADISIGFVPFCPTPPGCVDCELWNPNP